MFKKLASVFCFIIFSNIALGQWYSGSPEHKNWTFNATTYQLELTKKEKDDIFKRLTPSYITKPLQFPQTNTYKNLKNNNNIFFYIISPIYISN